MKKDFILINCPLCDSDSFKLLYKSTLKKSDLNPKSLSKNVTNSTDDFSKHATLVKCNYCGLVYTNPMENLSAILKAYEDVVDEEYLETEKFRKISLEKHLESLERFKRKGKLLDIGSFAGYFLELAKKKKWDSYGIEPSVWATKIAKKRGVKHLGKEIMKTKLKNNFFDAVTMWDVIEHLADPNKVVNKINGSLKKGGIIAIATPDIGSLYAKLWGSKCPFFIRMHIVLYNKKTLTKLLEDNGFKIVDVSYYGRTFPIYYLIDRFHFKTEPLKTLVKYFKLIPILPNIPITVNFRDSIRIIGQKK